MRAFLKSAAVLAGFYLLSACTAEELSETLFPDEVLKKIHAINDAITNRDYGAMRSMVVTSMSQEELEAKLDQVFVYLPQGTFVGRELAEFKKSSLKTASGMDRTTYLAGYQYEYADGWAYVTLVLIDDSGDVSLQRLNIDQLSQSLRQSNAFTFAGKGVVHYVVFALTVVIPLFIIATFVVCFQMRDLKRRKRWLAFILFGVGGVVLNWTTGALTIKILTIGLLGAGFFMNSTLAPVMLSVWLPLGAILFWIFRQSGKLALKRDQSTNDFHAG